MKTIDDCAGRGIADKVFPLFYFGVSDNQIFLPLCRYSPKNTDVGILILDKSCFNIRTGIL